MACATASRSPELSYLRSSRRILLHRNEFLAPRAATTAGTIAAAVATILAAGNQTVHPNSAPKRIVSRSDPQRPSAAAAPRDPAQSHCFLLSGNS